MGPSDGLLRLMAAEGNNMLRRSVAGRRNCPVDVLDRLAADPNPDVRAAVASNPAAPDQIRSAAALA